MYGSRDEKTFRVMKPCWGGVSVLRGRSSTTRSRPGLGAPVGTRKKPRDGFGMLGMMERVVEEGSLEQTG